LIRKSGRQIAAGQKTSLHSPFVVITTEQSGFLPYNQAVNDKKTTDASGDKEAGL
jgi:hypothetical protein